MTLPALADLEAFEARCPRELSDADETRAQALIDDASTKVRAVTGRTWLDDDDEVDADPEVVRIVLAAALRAFLNPGGLTSEVAGNWSGYYADGGVGIVLTDAEIDSLRAIVGASGIQSIVADRIDTVGPAGATWYTTDNFGGDAIAIGDDMNSFEVDDLCAAGDPVAWPPG